VENRVIGAGSAGFLEAMSIDLPPEAVQARQAWEAEGKAFTTVYMTVDEDVVMVLRLEDAIRHDAAAAVRSLRDAGVAVALLTGDSRLPASAVARNVGIADFCAGMAPTEKEAWIRRRQAGEAGPQGPEDAAESGFAAPLLGPARQGASRGKGLVGMLGDGLNDGPALAAADVGIAISCGLQLTIDAADVVVTKGGDVLLRLAEGVAVAKRGRRLLIQNLALALAIKLAVLVLAATGNLSLSTGILTDTGSLLLVLLNGLRPLAWQVGGSVPPAAASAA